MARLQRKKPVSKKKKKKGNDDSVAGGSENGTSEKKIVSLTDFSKDKKKQVKPRKKAPAAKQAKLEPGKWDKALQFLREVKIELKKVTWPSKNQTIGSTAVVIMLVMIISLFLGLVDTGLSSLVRLVLH